MSRLRLLSRAAVAAALCLASSAAVLAQSSRTFVSAQSGSDGNPCSLALPCRTFAVAVAAVNPGGEVVALDSGGYGSVTLTKSVSLVAPPGVYAGITAAPGGNAVTINASASDVIVLRGLSLNGGGGVGTNGIVDSTGGTLHVEKVFLGGFTATALAFAAPGQLYVSDTVAQNSQNGIIIGHLAAGTAAASLDRLRLEGNTTLGLAVGQGSKVVIRDSVASGNLVGMGASSASGTAELTVENCLVNDNRRGGIESGVTGPALVRVSGSTVTDNVIGLSQNGTSVLLSKSDNTVEGNDTDTSGAIGTYTPR